MSEVRKKGVLKLYSLQFLIAIACIAVSIIPMTYTGLSVYTKYSEQLVNNSNVFTEQIMDQLKINIEEYIRNGIKLNNDVAAMIDENSGILDSSLQDRLSVYYSSRNDLVSITLTDTSGRLLDTVPPHSVKESYDIKEEV